MVVDHATDMSVRQSTLQCINRFYLILLSSVDANNDVQIGCINLIIVIHIQGPHSGFFQPILLFIVSFHPYLVTVRFNSFQPFIRTYPYISFLIFSDGKYILDFTGQLYIFASVSFRIYLYQSIRSTYPQTIPRIQTETMDNSLHPPAFAVFQLKRFHVFRKRIDRDDLSQIVTQPNVSIFTFIYVITSGETGYFFPWFKMCIHRK